MRNTTVVLDNIRSAHNVGSIFRTADGLGVSRIVLCGITPYPAGADSDERLPHIARSADKMIAKTALGAEKSVEWAYHKSTHEAIRLLKSQGYIVVCLEQSDESISLEILKQRFPTQDIVLIVGPEVTGISDDILKLADAVVELPMHGSKESFNVAIAAAIAMYELTKA